MNDTTDALFAAWDEMNLASQRILTALPHQMTEAAARLDATRLAMGEAVRKIGLDLARRPAAAADTEGPGDGRPQA